SQEGERVHPPGARILGADAEHAPQAAVRSRPSWLLGHVPGLAEVLCEDDWCSLPVQDFLLKECFVWDRSNARRVRGGGEETPRSRQGGSGTGASAGLDDGHRRT